MRAITFQGIEDVRLREVPAPRIEDPADALVRVERAAICGSDLHVFHGRERGLDLGTPMGHEFLGIVVDVGTAVAGFRPGERVISPFSTSCGRCFFCVRGLTSRCVEGELFGWVEHGKGLPGAQAEYVRVPLADSALVHLPPESFLDGAILLADVLPTGFHAAQDSGASGEDVLAILGAGAVGLCALLAARERGVRRIFAFDALAERLEHAARLGATPVSITSREPTAPVRDATEGRGADAVIEAVGSPGATRLAVDLVRAGGTISAIGVHTEEAFAFSPAEAYAKNLTYRAGRAPVRASMERLLPWLRIYRNELAALISHRLPLEEGPRGYRIFDRKEERCMKVVLAP